MSFSEKMLVSISPGIAKYSDALLDAMRNRDISTFLRASHFLAQCAHESSGFSTVVENLNYSAERLVSVFPKYFDSNNSKLYARNPEKIANRVYANRMGNGPEESGDGWKYRGRGLIQLTGKDSYKAYGRGVDVEPELLETPTGAAESAAWFWSRNGINALADADDIKAVTRKVNGGLNGLDDRIKWLIRVEEALTVG